MVCFLFSEEFIRALYINVPAQLWDHMRVLRYLVNPDVDKKKMRAANSCIYHTHYMHEYSEPLHEHTHNLRESSIGQTSDCLGQMV